MRSVLLVVAALCLPACGGADERDDPPAAVGVPAGNGLTVSQALRSDVDDVLLVRGFLVVVDGDERICETLAESYPPQCGEASMPVRDLRLVDLPLKREGATEWTEEAVTLTGRLEDGSFVVDPTSLAVSG